MQTKTFQVSFYQQLVTSEKTFVSDLLKKEYKYQKKGNSPYTWKLNNFAFQLRDIVSINKGQSFTGIFVKFRLNDLPELGLLEGDLSKIDMSNHDGVVEKNYFLYERKREIITYQANKSGSSINLFSNFLINLSGLDETISFNPILKLNSAKRLMDKGIDIKKIEFSIARPSLSNINSNDSLTGFVKNLAQETNGYLIHTTISKEPSSSGEWLQQSVKQGLSLIANGGANVARAWTDEYEQPIDLIADRIKGPIKVDMEGYYPDSELIFKKMARLKNDFSEQIKESTKRVKHKKDK